MHNLSRGSRLLLTIFLTIAIVLPLMLLVPRYMDWQQAAIQREAATYTADIQNSFSR